MEKKFNISIPFIYLVTFFISTLVYFSLYPIFSYDSAWYLSFMDHFKQNLSMELWDKTRGYVFPFLIWFGISAFGDSIQGLTLIQFLFYTTSIIFIFKLINRLDITKIFQKIGSAILITLLVFLNPIFLGYYHLLLTEFVASTFLIIYVCYTYLVCFDDDLFLYRNFNLKNFIIQSILTAFTLVIMWHLKQMFALLILCVYAIKELILLFKFYSNKRLVFLLISFIGILLSLLLSIQMWNLTISSQTNKVGKSSSDYLSLQLVRSMRHFVPKDNTINYSKPTKIDIIIDNKVKQTFEYSFDGTLSNALKYIALCNKNDAKAFWSSYLDNFLLIANVYTIPDYNRGIFFGDLIKKYSINNYHENYLLACMYRYTDKDLILIDALGYPEPMNSYLKPYRQITNKTLIIKIIYSKILIQIANLLFSLMIILSFPIALCSVILLFRAIDKRKFLFYLFNIIISVTVFVYTVTLSILGSPIDRYMFPTYSLGIIMIINIFAFIIKSIKSKKED